MNCSTCNHPHSDHSVATFNNLYLKIRDLRQGCNTCYQGKEETCCSHCRCEECSQTFLNSLVCSDVEKEDFNTKTRCKRVYVSRGEEEDRCKKCEHKCHNKHASTSQEYNPYSCSCFSSIEGKVDWDTYEYKVVPVRDGDISHPEFFSSVHYMVEGKKVWVDFSQFKLKEVKTIEYETISDGFEDVSVTTYTNETELYNVWENELWHTKSVLSHSEPVYNYSNKLTGYRDVYKEVPVYHRVPILKSRTISKPCTKTVRQPRFRKVSREIVKRVKVYKCYPIIMEPCLCEVCHCDRCIFNRTWRSEESLFSSFFI
jgi:hypothetical protein